MDTHLSIDIETLDVDPSPNAAIIAVGAVAFNEEEIIDQREWLLNPVFSPGTRSYSTHKWWQEQEFEVAHRMFSGKVLPWDFCPEFSSFVGLNGCKQIWGFPIRFDVGHLRSLYRAVEHPFPLDFRAERDLSTLYDLGKRYWSIPLDLLKESLKREHREHDALSDALYQAGLIQGLLQIVRAGSAG